MRLLLAFTLLAAITALTQTATLHAQAKSKVSQQQIAAAEKTLIDFGCKLHRDEKVVGQAVDLVWFPPKTTNTELSRLVVSTAKLPGLKMIDLGETKVTDAGLKDLSKLPNLESAYLDHTAVTDAGIKDLAGLQKLAWLDLSNTKVTANGVDTIAGIKSLRHLFLDGIKLTTAEVAKIATLTQLKSLSQGGSVSDASLAEIAKLSELQTLRLERIPTTAGLKEIAKLTKIENLTLQNGLDSMTGDGWKVLSELPKLRSLDVSRHAQDNWSSYSVWTDRKKEEKGRARALPASAQGLADLTGLKNLDLTGHSIGDGDLKIIGKLGGLEELSLSCSLVTLEGVKDFAGLEKLQRLNIRNALVTDRGMRSLETLKELRFVRLYDNPITESGVKQLNKALPRCIVYWKYTKGPGDHQWRVPGGYGG